MPQPFGMLPILLVLVVMFVSLLRLWVRVLKEYERGVVFRLGRVLSQPKGPGLIFLFWPLDRMVTIPLRTVVLDVPPQDVITRGLVRTVVVSEGAVQFRLAQLQPAQPQPSQRRSWRSPFCSSFLAATRVSHGLSHSYRSDTARPSPNARGFRDAD